MQQLLSIVFMIVLFAPSLLGNESQFGLSGSGFIESTWNTHEAKRERLAVAEIESGNIPKHLMDLVPITVESGKQKITFYVMPDYIAIGNDADYVTYPLNYLSAVKVAKRMNMVLPTTKMVDLIYEAASKKIRPAPMNPGRRMSSNAYIKKHDQGIKSQLLNSPKGMLIAGHKKDTVVSNRLINSPDRIAIYGWHLNNKKVVQPLNTWHTANYADYSHGVRLIDRQVLVNGEIWDIADVLMNDDLAPMISKEGTMNLEMIMTPTMKRSDLSHNN